MIKIDKRNNEVSYKDEGSNNKKVLNKHFLHEIERHHPLSIGYKKYWKEIKRRCMEGYWFEGKWMPGNLYFYVNLCKIRLNKTAYSTTKVVGKPWLRDLEWEKAYVFTEARGFSGFRDDNEYSCWLPLKDIDSIDEQKLSYIKKIAPEEVKKPNGEFKKYTPVRAYLRKIHSTNLGKPLYQNEAKNVLDIEARGGGKSYFGANAMVLHTWLMDGVYDYDDYLYNKDSGTPYSVDVLVGAIDGKYTKDLLDKVNLGLNNLEGSDERNGIIYNSPLVKKHTGSWFSGKQFIENKYDVKKGGEWFTKGTGSKIYHRTFKDDPHAGNGIRTSLGVIEEVGFFGSLVESLGHIKDTTYDGTRKFGTIYMFGTSGDMEGGSSEAAMEVFYNPKEYDCLTFENIWEETGDIGFFVPYQLTLNQFKDVESGTTDIDAANVFIENKRRDLKNSKNKGPLYRELQNNPITPSEAFLIVDSNIFPVGELKEHLNWLKSNQQDAFISGQCGELIYGVDESGEVNLKWKPDLNNRLSPCGFKMKKSDDTTGCIQIWEHPYLENGKVPWGLYVAGTDPYDQDQAQTTASLGSTFIYKTFSTSEGIYEWPVAEYTARPKTAEEHHETVRRLLLYYNAIDLYENERNTLKMHFSHKHSLHLLAKTPTILKATENSTVQRQYGIHMTKMIKNEIEIYTRDWLLREAENGKLNLHKIYSISLLEELIYYNDRGNFDRVIAFMLTILHRLQNHHIKVENNKEEVKKNLDSFLGKVKYFFN